MECRVRKILINTYTKRYLKNTSRLINLFSCYVSQRFTCHGGHFLKSITQELKQFIIYEIILDEATSIIEFTDLLKNFRFNIWRIEIILCSVSVHDVTDYGPPRHSMLVLIIDVSILPVTILSRCLRGQCFHLYLIISGCALSIKLSKRSFSLWASLLLTSWISVFYFLKTLSWLIFCPLYSLHIFIESYLPCLASLLLPWK